jgi:hypothetical protein
VLVWQRYQLEVQTMMRYKANKWITPFAALAVGALVASGQELEIARSTIDGGGVMFSTGADFKLSGTIGQPDADVMSGGDFELSGGFWFGEPPDDCNSDGCVDLVDYDDLDDCLSGPDGGLLFPDCNCFDVDGDSDVDLSDIARFQAEFTGG